MQQTEFIRQFKQRQPRTTSPVVCVDAIPIVDTPLVKSVHVSYYPSDAVKVAKVAGTVTRKDYKGEIHVALVKKPNYTEEDVARAINLILEADSLTFNNTRAVS